MRSWRIGSGPTATSLEPGQSDSVRVGTSKGAVFAIPAAMHLTMVAKDVLEASSAFARSAIVPVHTDGWAHLMESGGELADAVAALKVADGLVRLLPGVPRTFDL